MNLEISTRFDLEKAIETILFITGNTSKSDIYHVLKILYFADKKHLEKYGRFISGDNYSAMAHGPVPSTVYDIIKFVRGDGIINFNEEIKDIFAVKDNLIIPKRNSNIDFLSQSEIECISESIEENGSLSFGELLRKSHDEVYKSVDEGDSITEIEVAKVLKVPHLLEHILGEYI